MDNAIEKKDNRVNQLHTTIMVLHFSRIGNCPTFFVLVPIGGKAQIYHLPEIWSD